MSTTDQVVYPRSKKKGTTTKIQYWIFKNVEVGVVGMTPLKFANNIVLTLVYKIMLSSW